MCNEIDCKKSLVYSLRAKMRGHYCLVQLQLKNDQVTQNFCCSARVCP